MAFEELEKRIRAERPEIELRASEPMSRHTSFKIGGAAALMALPQTKDELLWLARAARESGVKPFVFGNGTNLLVRDGPWDAFVIKTANMRSIELAEDNMICAAGGALLSRISMFALKKGLTGLEFAHGIPGTAGGGAIMNAGAYGGELKDVCVGTEHFDGELRVRFSEGEAQGFRYRGSAFSDAGDVVLGVHLRLVKGDENDIKEKMIKLARYRRASQPLSRPSAGSAFKRPKEGYAAELIDNAGLKGLAIGGAQVSKKHAGFIVNRGGATCEDVLRLMERIQSAVYAVSGVTLEPEIRVVGGGGK